MMKRFRQLSTPLMVLAAVAVLPWAPAARSQETPPQKIDVSKLRSSVDDVVIPVPSEIFNALDKLGGSLNWSGQVMPDTKARMTTPAEIALLLGTVIANGFIAVEAKQADKVQETGRRVIALSDALGVKDAVLKHCNSIIDAAKKDEWTAVRTELDKAQSSVKNAMAVLDSKDEAELVSIAGWLRGTQAISSLITSDYKPDRAELLHQPDMLTTFDRQLGSMKPRVQGNRKVKELQEGLRKIKPLVSQMTADTIPQKSVEQINQVTTGLVKTISP